MPRVVRNFWIDVDHSTRKHDIGTGPIGATGWLKATIGMRDQGDILKAYTILGDVVDDKLVVSIYDNETQECVATKTKERNKPE